MLPAALVTELLRLNQFKVELIQLYTLAGESNQKLDTKYTNAEVTLKY